MHRFFSTAASAAFVLTIAACGSPPEDQADDLSAPAASAAPEPRPVPTASALPGPVETPESAASAAAPAVVKAAAPAAAVAAAPAAAPPAAFMQCRACHAVEPGRHGIGPSLHGIYGTKAGDIPGYAVSGPLKASGLTWDDATLDTWLQGSSKMVPGTRMVFAGMPDPAKRKAVIEYMKTLK